MVEEGFPHRYKDLPTDMKLYWNVQEHLWWDRSIVMKGSAIVIPSVLRHRTLNDLHASHQGQTLNDEQGRQCISPVSVMIMTILWEVMSNADYERHHCQRNRSFPNHRPSFHFKSQVQTYSPVKEANTLFT